MNKQQIKKTMIDRLCNTAKGHAQYVMLNKNMSNEQRQAEFEVIEEFVEYIRNYDKNIQLLQEYKEWQFRHIDDGR